MTELNLKKKNTKMATRIIHFFEPKETSNNKKKLEPGTINKPNPDPAGKIKKNTQK